MFLVVKGRTNRIFFLDFSVFRLYPVLSSIFHSAPGPLLLHHCRQGDLPRRAVAAFGHMLFHCANEQSPRLPSTLGYAPLSFVAEDANFLRATGCYGDIYPLLQKRFSSAKVLTPVLGSYLRIRNTTLLLKVVQLYSWGWGYKKRKRKIENRKIEK